MHKLHEADAQERGLLLEDLRGDVGANEVAGEATGQAGGRAMKDRLRETWREYWNKQPGAESQTAYQRIQQAFYAGAALAASEPSGPKKTSVFVTERLMSEAFAASVNRTDPDHPHIYDHRIAAEFINKRLGASDLQVKLEALRDELYNGETLTRVESSEDSTPEDAYSEGEQAAEKRIRGRLTAIIEGKD